MIGYAIAGAVVAASGLLVAGLCRAASTSDPDDPPDTTPDDAGLFHIPPPKED